MSDIDYIFLFSKRKRWRRDNRHYGGHVVISKPDPFGLHQWATSKFGYTTGIARKEWAEKYWIRRLNRGWNGK